MSSTTVSYRSTSMDAGIDDLRRQEAEARQAARRAAERAEAQRRREEAVRRRIDAANRIVTEQDDRFRSAVVRLDEAARRLPDLALVAPPLPALSGEIASNPQRLEAYAEQVRATVERFERQLETAISEAERLLRRRFAKAAAWRTAADLEQQVAQRTQTCRELADRLGNKLVSIPALAKPHAEAELEPVEAYVSALNKLVIEREREYANLRAQQMSRTRAVGLSGSTVMVDGADVALSRYEAERRQAARSALLSHRDGLLAKASLQLAEMPRAVCAMMEDAFEHAHTQDQRERVTSWIAREQQRRIGVEQALALLQCVPDLVHDEPSLARRWEQLVVQLQRIAGGLDDFGPGIEREYDQLRVDARRFVKCAFTKVDWVQAMREQDFEVCEREDSQGLIVVDLDHPEVWLEATELETEQGGFAATLELKTDAQQSVDESAVTDDVCARLARVAGSARPDTVTEAEVIERKSRITRGRRPAKAKTFATPL